MSSRSFYKATSENDYSATSGKLSAVNLGTLNHSTEVLPLANPTDKFKQEAVENRTRTTPSDGGFEYITENQSASRREIGYNRDEGRYLLQQFRQNHVAEIDPILISSFDKGQQQEIRTFDSSTK